ncbi:Aldo/keto reductase [Cylindrobasidium torrendii FP15055 ss-10]|uniref:Aldo/keto reductase n=1 Tax=Cylindrobasidium torrendii FP15055 ss-10 TaxID=1314674 RepID=A0A0D7BD66_9AGAR|nr:Aldo/keto reductase [Cylindrobasidium torrendii FP15055 ss-10]
MLEFWDVHATVKLNDGSDMPVIGLGVWAGSTEKSDVDAAEGWVKSALEAGYRHIDTSSFYETEPAVGRAIKSLEPIISRDKVYLTTKLGWNGQEHVEEFFAQSLENFQTNYVNQYLIHWPQAVEYDPKDKMPKHPDGTFRTSDATNFNITWSRLEKLRESGRTKSIGVSNFSEKTLEQLFKTAKVIPAVNQVEIHPYLVQEDLVRYCQSKGIVVVAYTPTGKEAVRNDPVILSIARKYNATATQVILAWHLARGIAIIPKSANLDRQKENLVLPKLADEDVRAISALDRNDRLSNREYETKGTLWGWTYEQYGWPGEARQ